jgi:hypothetical protein
MRKFQNDEFDRTFDDAFRNYVKGDWARSEDLLGQCLRKKPADGPSKTLKRIIESENGTAPHNWKGFRELTEK